MKSTSLFWCNTTWNVNCGNWAPGYSGCSLSLVQDEKSPSQPKGCVQGGSGGEAVALVHWKMAIGLLSLSSVRSQPTEPLPGQSDRSPHQGAIIASGGPAGGP